MVKYNGLSKAEVLAVLYNSAKKPTDIIMRMFFATVNNAGADKMSVKEAEQLLKTATSFDYIKGRTLKVDLSNDEEFDEELYNRDNGAGGAEVALMCYILSKQYKAKIKDNDKAIIKYENKSIKTPKTFEDVEKLVEKFRKLIERHGNLDDNSELMKLISNELKPILMDINLYREDKINIDFTETFYMLKEIYDDMIKVIAMTSFIKNSYEQTREGVNGLNK